MGVGLALPDVRDKVRPGGPGRWSRRRTAAAAALALVLVIAGCGNGATSAGSGSSTSPATSSAGINPKADREVRGCPPAAGR